MRRVKGISFVAALVCALILASGFLAYFVWGPPGRNGSLAALEPPVAPPPMGAKPSSTSSAEHLAVNNNAVKADDDSQAVRADSTRGVTLSAPEKTNISNPTVNNPSGEAALGKAPKHVEPSVKKVSQSGKHSGPKDTKKAKKSSSAASKKRNVKQPVEEQEDITRVPPEWNWFDTPLKMDIRDGKVIIEAANPPQEIPAARPVSENRDCDIEVKEEKVDIADEAVPSESSESLETLSSETSDPKDEKMEGTVVAGVVTDPAGEKEQSVQNFKSSENSDEERIAVTLARLQARHALRAEEARNRGIVLPSEGGDSRYVPASLVKLIQTLDALVPEKTGVFGNPSVGVLRE